MKDILKKWTDTVRLLFLILGLAFVFYGNRYLAGQAAGTGFVIAGIASMLLGLVGAVLGMVRSDTKAESQSRKYTVYWQVSLLVGIALYYVYVKVLGTAAEPETLFSRVLLGLWLSVLLLSLFWGMGVEWTFRLSGRGRFAEPRRVERAGMSWLLVGLLLCSIAALNYTAIRKDRSWDWSYLKTAQVSDATVNILGSLDKELRVGLFFAPTNEVTSHVRSYFDSLPNKAKNVKVEYFDVELNPAAAEEFKASRNGQVVLRYGDVSERLDIGTTLSTARKTLRNLDAEFQKSLLAATQKRKVLYFTRGHGELAWSGADNSDPLKTIKLLEGFLRGQNYTLRYFGVGEGSTKQIPEDADAVVVMGGNTSMLPEEVAAINDYVDKGGSVLAFVDMDGPSDNSVTRISRDISKDPFIEFLANHGVRYVPVPLANATNFVAATRSDVDAWFLYTNGFGTHDSVTALARNDQRAAILTFRSGYFEVTSEFNGWQNFETVRSLSDSFADENRDFKFNDGKEARKPYVQGVATARKEAVQGKKGKLVVLSDASAASDVLIRNQGNLIYIVEALRWLVGDVAGAGSGVGASEEDVRIQHTRKEDLAWFYGTVVLVPLLVLGLGFLATRRSRRKAQA